MTKQQQRPSSRQAARSNSAPAPAAAAAAAAAAVLLVLTVVCSTTRPATAYPILWATNFAAGAGNCLAHPTSRHGDHGYQQEPDKDTTFSVLLASSGQPVPGGNAVCAGEIYTVRAMFPKVSHLLMASSSGNFGTRRCDSICPNRVCPGSSTVVATYNLTLPCDAAGSIEVSITRAEASNAALKTSRITLQVDPTCQKPATCDGNNSPTNPPEPSPAPSPKPPSPPALTVALTKSHNKALSLTKPQEGVTLTVLLSGPKNRRSNRTLRVTVPKTLDCKPSLLVTDVTGQAELKCVPKAKGAGRVTVSLGQLRANVTVRVTA